MSQTTTAGPDAAAATAASDEGGRAGSRSKRAARLQIADRVVEKIAARAVAEVEYATGVTRQVLGLGRGRSPTTARVSASVDGDTATLRVTMMVPDGVGAGGDPTGARTRRVPPRRTRLAAYG